LDFIGREVFREKPLLQKKNRKSSPRGVFGFCLPKGGESPVIPKPVLCIYFLVGPRGRGGGRNIEIFGGGGERQRSFV